MSDNKRILLYFEGADDGAILKVLKKLDLLPPQLELAAKPSDGLDNLIRNLLPLAGPAVGGRAIALRDLDELTDAQIGPWLARSLRDELAQQPEVTLTELAVGRVPVMALAGTQHTGRVAAVASGLPGEADLQDYEITQFAIDDYLLRLVRDAEVYGAVTEFHEVPHDAAMRKLLKVVDLLRSNHVAIRHSKRMLHVLRGITGFRASPATFAERLIEITIKVKGQDHARRQLSPLVTDLEVAVAALTHV